MADELLKRVMPNNVEAEQSVIGAMLMDRDAITIASEILTVDDFYQKQYGILFEAMVELFNEGSFHLTAGMKKFAENVFEYSPNGQTFDPLCPPIRRDIPWMTAP